MNVSVNVNGGLVGVDQSNAQMRAWSELQSVHHTRVESGVCYVVCVTHLEIPGY